MEALKKMTNISKLEQRKAYLRKIRDPETGEIIDKGLCLWFPGMQIVCVYNRFYFRYNSFHNFFIQRETTV